MGNERYTDTSDIRTYRIPDNTIPPEARRILLLEDETPLAEHLRELLESHGFLVTQVVNGAEGLRAMMVRDYDVIVCDMVMPGFPGDMFYVAVQQTRRYLCERFLFMSGHRADPRIDGFIRRVRGLVLWKPFEPYELLNAIRIVLKRTGVRWTPLPPASRELSGAAR
jgi:DNA-binding response OmpR family regulator